MAAVALAGFAPAQVRAQEAGRLVGAVVDAKTLEPMPFVQVSLYQGDSLVRRTMSDFDGVFKSGPMPVGEYVMKVSTVGYHDVEKTVILRPSGFWMEDVHLEADPSKQVGCPVIEMGHKPEVVVAVEEETPPPPPPSHDMDVVRCGIASPLSSSVPPQQEYEKEGVRVVVK